jgi:hypothetical protein
MSQEAHVETKERKGDGLGAGFWGAIEQTGFGEQRHACSAGRD